MNRIIFSTSPIFKKLLFFPKTLRSFINPNNINNQILSSSPNQDNELFNFSKLAKNSKILEINENDILLIDVHGHIFNEKNFPPDLILSFINDIIPNPFKLKNIISNKVAEDMYLLLTKVIENSIEGIEFNEKIMRGVGMRFLDSCRKSYKENLNDWYLSIKENEKLLVSDEDVNNDGKKIGLNCLTIDFDKGFDIREENKMYKCYYDQFDDIKVACEQFNDDDENDGIAFYSFALDPRKLENKESKEYQEYLSFLRDNVENSNAVSCKMYPSLGFLPSHPVLMKEVYKYFEEYQIPIIVHCARGLHGGGICTGFDEFDVYSTIVVDENFEEKFEKVDFSKQGYFGENFLPLKWFFDIACNTSREQKLVYFNHPKQWEIVFQNFPKLKVCFSHFGGNSEIKREKGWRSKDDKKWNEIILDYVNTYPNIYFDISYISSRLRIGNIGIGSSGEKIEKYILSLLDNDRIKSRILFGTDFYMQKLNENTDEQIKNIFEKYGNDIFTIGKKNTFRFLTPSV